MRRFKNILLVVAKKSDNAALIARAIARAKRNEATLTVVDVLREPGIFSLCSCDTVSIAALPEGAPGADLCFGEASVGDLRGEMAEHRRNELTQIVKQAGREGVDASAEVLFGVPFVEIIRRVIRKGHDLVMITAEGRRNIRQMLFGRTSMHLMRKCPCPVWVFKPSQHLPHDRVLAAIDPMPYDEMSDGLNRKILDLAVSLAEFDSAHLYVVHAWAWLRVLGETRTLAFEPMDDCTLVSELRRIGRECIDRLLEEYEPKNARITIHTPEGCPEEVIPDFARSNEVDLIVMGTVHKIGLGGFFMGSTAETVLRNADCSVLTIKPGGFVSPITQG